MINTYSFHCTLFSPRTKSVCENLKMSPAMLSRFDLIFILVDKPDDALDQRVSEHVLALHSGEGGLRRS